VQYGRSEIVQIAHAHGDIVRKTHALTKLHFMAFVVVEEISSGSILEYNAQRTQAVTYK
jgi:ABC-type antimicrobial peptide transport system permease subunit